MHSPSDTAILLLGNYSTDIPAPKWYDICTRLFIVTFFFVTAKIGKIKVLVGYLLTE